jgi:ABC-type branched-subunit amino acid transport system ATPase component
VFGRLTVRENLEMGAFRRRDVDGIRDDLERTLTLFPRLRERLTQTAGTLSGGEQQMLALSVARRAYVLQTGEIILQGTAAQLRENPDVKKAYLGG